MLKNTIRNLLGIRKERQLLPAGPKPMVGSNIVRERMRIRLKYPISEEQWEWFVAKGWRTVDMRGNRRRYISVPDKGLIKLLLADELEREILHQKLIALDSEESRIRRREENAKNNALPSLCNSTIAPQKQA